METDDPEEDKTRKNEEPAGARSAGEESPSNENKGDPKQPRRWGNKVRDNRGQAVNAGRIEGGVHYHGYIDERVTHRLRQTARVGPERVREVRATFCPSDPDRYALFRSGLCFHGTGVITGQPGTGRTITAVAALESCRPGTPIEQLAIDPKEKDAGTGSIDIDSENSRYLDLTSLPEPTSAQQVALRGLVEDVRKAGALLVLIARPEQREEHLAEHTAWLDIAAPARAIDVFARAMRRKCGDEITDEWLRSSQVREELEGAEPARALRIVREAERHRIQKQHSDGAAWIKEVLKECADNTEELARWFQRHDLESEFERVLLTALALLEGGRRETIVEHADRLARLWHVPPLWRTPISGEGLTTHLREAGAHVREEGVHFTRRGYGDDVLDYLWREHPGTRDSLQQWATKAVTDLPHRQRFDAARRWLRLARRHGDVSPVRTLIDRWGQSPSLMWEAVPIIAEAAVTPELGARVRSALYEAALSSGRPLRDRTVLEVCRVYGRLQPASALTRLRHIAEKVPATWDERLVCALQDIAGEPGNTAVFVERMLSWARTPERGRRGLVAGLTLCRVLGDRGEDAVPCVPVATIEGGIDVDTVLKAWGAIAPLGTETERPLWAWCDFLESGVRDNSKALEVLLRAAREHPRLSRSLRRCVTRWRHAHERRSPVLDELVRSLDQREEKT